MDMPEKHPHPYVRLATMIALSFLAMYIFTYATVDHLANAYPSLNRLYMAALMAAPVLVLEMLLMGRMYPNVAWNGTIVSLGVVAIVLLWFAIRQQVGMTDRNLVRSMIPHHAGAILMCQQAPISRADLIFLCEEIVEVQQREIDQMRTMLASEAPVRTE